MRQGSLEQFMFVMAWPFPFSGITGSTVWFPGQDRGSVQQALHKFAGMARSRRAKMYVLDLISQPQSVVDCAMVRSPNAHLQAAAACGMDPYLLPKEQGWIARPAIFPNTCAPSLVQYPGTRR